MTTHREFQEINLIYQTIIERLLRCPLPLPEVVQQAAADGTAPTADAGAPQEAASWIELLNLAVTPHLLRTYVLENNPKDSALRSLIRFLVSKPLHSQEDHDKVDWLVTHLFSIREAGSQRPTAWPKMDVNEILSGLEFPSLSMQSEDMLMEMPALIDEVKYFRTFSEITDSHIIRRARDMKNLFGE
ncbi:MAG: hypothetical protein EXQ56_11010 [Acidobacteria bacterium]|nr:hypothetical protein [Acidobacteriota bacterium]